MKGFVGWCVDTFQHYVVFHKSILFVFGLIFGFELVENLFMSILVTYLISPKMDYNLQTVAILINLSGGISSVLAIFMAFVADAYVGLFQMLIAASTLCVAGLVLTRFAATKNEDYEIAFQNMFYGALLLLTLSEAAMMGTLNLFLADQVTAGNQIQNQTLKLKEDRLTQQRVKLWFVFVSIFAAIFTLFGPLKNSWLTDLVGVLAIVMGATFLIFLLGFKFYNRVNPTGSALSDVPVVVRDAIVKRNVAHNPQSSEQQLIISPRVSWLRWLDRAALVQENRLGGRVCKSVEQVKGVKSFLQMLPMWSTFITFSFVSACGDTFFAEEASSITEYEDMFPILFFFKVWTYTSAIVALISTAAIEKLSPKQNHKMMLVRIGLGLICCVLCCIAAWYQAHHRFHILETYGQDEGFRLMDYMSVYRFTPHFLLLGFMEGLSLEGLQIFFESQVPRSMYRYGPSLGRFVMGFGRFVSIAFILVLNKCFVWFGDDIETSRLDDIYVFLGGLSCANLIVYCFVACWYQDHYSSLQTDSSSSIC